MIPIYSNSDITLYHTDCLDFLKEQKSDSIKFTLTSPPYDNIRNYNGYSFPFEEIATELYRVTKKGGVVAWNVADATINGSESGTSMRQALFFMSLGFRLHDTMIYAKNNPIPANVTSKRYHQAWEYIFILSKDSPETFNPITVKSKYGHLSANTKYRGKDGTLNYKKTKRNEYTKVRNIFEYSIGGGISATDKIAFKHPAIMPEKLASDMIYTWTNEGDTIFDPFTGSGTTAKMSATLKRKFVGTEMSLEYCNVFKERLDNYFETLNESIRVAETQANLPINVLFK